MTSFRRAAQLGDAVASVVTAIRLVWAADRRSAGQIGAAQIASAVALIGQLWALRNILSRLEAAQGFADLWSPVAVLAACGLTVSISGAVIAETRFVANERVVRSVVLALMEAANRCDLVDFDDDEMHDVMARATRNTSGRIWSAVWSSINLASASLSVVALGTALVVVAPTVLFIAAAGALVPLAVARKNNRLLFDLNYEYTPDDRRRVALQGLITRQNTVPEVRAYQAEGEVLKRISSLFDDRVERAEHVVRTRLRRNVLAATISYALGFLAVAYLINQISTHRLALADGAVALVVLQQVASRMRSASSAVVELGDSSLYLADYRAFINLAAAIPSRRVGSRLAAACVEANDLTFTYPGSKEPAVEGVSLSVCPGEVVAIVGENGSGKSSLVKLLAGLYEPQEGQIRWGGTTCARSDLQVSTALMFQDFQRYPLSLRDNVIFGDLERATNGPVFDAALQRSGVDELLLAMEQGPDTILSREYVDGVQLSGGEWQRVAIARAFYRDAPLLILDEPSAALDPRREAQLFESLRSLFADRAVVFISHRLSTVRTADRIYVLRSGRLVEAGSHDELMAFDGNYAELYRLQSTSSV